MPNESMLVDLCGTGLLNTAADIVLPPPPAPPAPTGPIPPPKKILLMDLGGVPNLRGYSPGVRYDASVLVESSDECCASPIDNDDDGSEA